MRNSIPRRLLPAVAAAGLATRRSNAQTAGWPARPVRIIVPFTPGGSNDAMARPLAERLHARFGQPFVIENRPGAGSAVGVGVLAQSPPDGHTLLVTTSSIAAIGAVQGTGFDPAAELDAVALLARAPLVALTPPASPIDSVTALVAADRARPGTLHYASSGPGSTTHIMAELFNLRAGTRLQHVPYRGTAPLLTDLLAGRLDIVNDNLPAYPQLARDGKVKLLAVTSAERWYSVPDVPTVAEAGGLPGFSAMIWWGVQAPAGTPAPIIKQLSDIIQEGFATTEVRDRLRNYSIEPAPQGTEDFARHLEAEHKRWGEVVRSAGITLG
jgi:tripartite-type tricarboxylate transporter receptor subunit TctC